MPSQYTFTLGTRRERGPSGSPTIVPSVDSAIAISGGQVSDERVQDLRVITQLAEEAPQLDLSRQETLLDTIKIVSVADLDVLKSIRSKESYFSDLWYSVGADGSTQIGFYFDKNRFLKDNAAFPALFDVPQNSVPDSITDYQSGIRSISLVRRTMHNTKKATSSSIGSGLSLIPNDDDVLLPEALVPDNRTSPASSSGFVYYTAGESADQLLSTASKIQYGVEVSMMDKTPKVMIEMYKLLFHHANELSALHSEIVDSNRIDEYDPASRRFVKSMSSLDTPLGALIETKIVAAKAVLTETVILLATKSQNAQTPYRRVINSYANSILGSRNPRGILEMSERMNILGTKVLNEVKKVFPGIGPSGDTGKSTGGTRMQASAARPVLYRHYFAEYIDRFEKEGFGYKFIPVRVSRDNPLGFGEISNSSYQDRANSEANKYFDVEAIENIEESDLRRILDPTFSSYTYFSPMGMEYPSLLGTGGERTNRIILDSKRRKGHYEARAQALAVLLGHKAATAAGAGEKYAMPLPWIKSPTPAERFSSIIEHLVKGSGCSVAYVAPNDNEVNVMSRSAITDFFGVELQPTLTKEERKNLESQQTEANISILTPENPPKKSSKFMMTLLSGMSLEGKQEQSVSYMDKDFNSLSFNIDELEDLFETPDLIPPSAKAIIANSFAAEDPDGTVAATLRSQSFTKSGDQLKDVSKFAATWLDYKHLMQVEFLAGFGNKSDSQNRASGKDVGQPNWEQITPTAIQNHSEKTLLCRLSPVSGGILEQALGIKELDLFKLPIYNRYFMLNVGSNPESPEPREDRNLEAQLEQLERPEQGRIGNLKARTEKLEPRRIKIAGGYGT